MGAVRFRRRSNKNLHRTAQPGSMKSQSQWRLEERLMATKKEGFDDLGVDHSPHGNG
jgi:hypothetical protein